MTHSEHVGFTVRWVDDHPQVVEEFAVEIIALWLGRKSFLTTMDAWCKARGLHTLTFYKDVISPVQRRMRLEGYDSRKGTWKS